ncbi:hypothetical protein [Leptospira kmetyi]|uniref:Uncharacterized protein n=1 Tax=Leptospira kmetyi TaxID=408139 RepID=A0AAD0URE6_9LEPT|nr:hypothetical protein EFP84_03835 [Leptospira kmetyi]PJZ31601.1 hypothetical protein CH378_02055 [Leptospira kmetyi]PJZ42651.1 hypothetical protein CH370_05420 [Leptospira kmetyi]
MRQIVILTLIFGLTSLWTGTSYASGGFSGGGVAQIPKGKDREKYHLGKSVYNREIEIPAGADPSKTQPQKIRLEYLQGSLPNSEKQRVNLEELAGKLTPEQLDALEYFVSVRFNVRLEEKKE